MYKKIVAIGPESTGKSTLCTELSVHFNTIWCPEYAREYLLKYGKAYDFDTLLTIAQGQLQLESKCIEQTIKSNSSLLFVDTDMYVMKVWCEYVFEKCHQFILDQIGSMVCDLYLLCDIDLPWTADELREYPDPLPRKELFYIYKDILVNQSVPFVIISGTESERLHKAINAVNHLL